MSASTEEIEGTPVVPKAREDRPFDLVVFGATGFTGSLVFEYLATSGPKNLKFAIAGRSKSKLEDVKQRISAIVPSAATTPILIADSSDQHSLDETVAQTRVVISTVGPFLKFGEPLVNACVRMRTDYIDSTGETPFISNMIEKYHAKAVEAGVKIVPSCGFDSIPSDLGALLVTDHFAHKGLKTTDVKYTAYKVKGGASGGTVHSVMNILEQPFKMKRRMADPYYLIKTLQSVQPEEDKKALELLPKAGLPVTLKYDKDFEKWQTYFVMESANSRLVRYTWHLLSKAYGPNFTYNESMSTRGFLSAFITTTAITIGVLFALLPPVRWLIKRLVPQGSGPTEEAMRSGFFESRLVGTAENGSRALAVVKGVSDPGYRETAKMLSESGLALLEVGTPGFNKDTGAFPIMSGGILTSASAMGLVLVERLRNAGMTFEVKDL